MVILLVLPTLAWPGTTGDARVDYEETLIAIAAEIELLKTDYPQLREFKAEHHFDREALRIDYEYHTHPPQRSGGWTAAVPNPDPDGIWFHIDIHDPSSNRQIHQQPMVPTRTAIGAREAFMLSLEGTDTRSVSDRLWQIVEQHADHPETVEAPPPVPPSPLLPDNGPVKVTGLA